jgi:hypothetical protein
MTLRTTLAIGLVFGCSFASGKADLAQSVIAVERHPEIVSPAWRIDLRSNITGIALGLVPGRREFEGKPHTSLLFTDNDTIAITFVIRHDNPQVSRRATPDEDSPLRLRAIFLDATNGKIRNTLTSPTDSRYSSIVVSRDGKFVTERGTLLTLYSPAMQELKKLELPPTNEIGWLAHPSGTGRTVLFVPSALRTSSVPWIWVDVDSLRIIREWQEVRSGWVAIADDKIAMTACVWVYTCEPKIEVRSLAADWAVIATGGAKNKPRLTFADDDTLFLLGNPRKLVRTNGDVVLEDRSFEMCWWGEGVSSALAVRLAVPSCKRTGAVPALDMQGSDVFKRILLYDAPFHSLSYTLEIKGPDIKDLTKLAISPDGLKLAILNDDSVEVVQLPPLTQ